MSNILLSIKPKYAELILSGKKSIELRKSAPRREVEWIYLYVTAPVKKIVGRVRIMNFIRVDENTKYPLTDYRNVCVNDDKEFVDYVGDKAYYLWYIDHSYRQRCSMELSEFNLKHPPQSWCYVEMKGE